jgi:hypothetical protein
LKVAWFWAFLGSCTLQSAIVYGEGEFASSQDLARIRFMAEGWIANHASFQSYRCKMQIRQGQCASVEKARVGGPDRNVANATAVMVVDGANVRYVRRSDEKPRFNPVSRTSRLGLAPVGFLLNGERALDVDFFAHGATLRDQSTWVDRGVDFTTWNEAGSRACGERGHFGPYVVQMLSLGRSRFRLHGPVEMNGVVVTRIDKEWDRHVISWFVDEQRGFIPVEMWFTLPDGKILWKMFVTKMRHFTPGRWFPERCVSVHINGDEEDGSHNIRDVVVTDLEVDIQPEPEEFQIDLPQGMRLQKDGMLGSVIVLPAPKTVGLDNLDTWEQRTVTRAEERARAENPPKNDARMVWLVAAIGAALMVLGIVIAMRRMRA